MPLFAPFYDAAYGPRVCLSIQFKRQILVAVTKEYLLPEKKVPILASVVIQNGGNHLFCPFCQGINKSQTSCYKKTTISIEVVFSQLIEADVRKLPSLLTGVK